MATEWTQEQREQAFRDLQSRGFLRRAISFPIVLLQCEVTALREALEEARPLLDASAKDLDNCFDGAPHSHEKQILRTYTECVKKIDALLTKIPK